MEPAAVGGYLGRRRGAPSVFTSGTGKHVLIAGQAASMKPERWQARAVSP